MDRDRLKEVHTTDLTESRVNEDFVDWAKHSLPTWLAMILIAVALYVAIVQFKQHKASYRSQAWAALNAADLPKSLEDVAREYEDVGRLSSVANLAAGDALLRAVQNGLILGVNPPPPLERGQPPAKVDPADQLTDSQRTEYLERADAIYQRVIDADDESDSYTIFAVGAMEGKAAVAEGRGDGAEAHRWYEEAAARAKGTFPGLAAQARSREKTADLYSRPVTLPTQLEFRQFNGMAPRRAPVAIDAALEDLIQPEPEEKSG